MAYSCPFAVSIRERFAGLGVVSEIIARSWSSLGWPDESPDRTFIGNDTSDLKNRRVILNLNLADDDGFLALLYRDHRGALHPSRLELRAL